MESKFDDNSTKNLKSKIEQILPDYITSDTIFKSALCIKISNKDTSLFLTKLKKDNIILDKIYLKSIYYQIKNIYEDYHKPNKIEEISKFKEYDGTFLKRVKKYVFYLHFNNKFNLNK